MAKKKEIKIGYRITKIHSTKFSFEDIEENELGALVGSPDGLGIHLNVSLNINKEQSSITIDVSSELFNAASKDSLVKHTGRTSFFIEGLDSTYNKQSNAYDLPNSLLFQIYGIAYTHARALLVTEISPTVYRDKYFLPVIDPTLLLNKKK